MSIQSKELREYMKEVRESILAEQEEGLELTSDIEFDLAVVNTKEVDGGIKLFVVNAKGRKETEYLSRIKFSMILHLHYKRHKYLPYLH